MKRAAIERAAALAGTGGGLLAVGRLRAAQASLIITGNEVYHGIIEDRFVPIFTNKVEA